MSNFAVVVLAEEQLVQLEVSVEVLTVEVLKIDWVFQGLEVEVEVVKQAVEVTEEVASTAVEESKYLKARSV